MERSASTTTTSTIDGERQHRAQTNVAVLVGIVSHNPGMKFAVNTKTGEVYATNELTGKPLEIATTTVRVIDANGDATFYDVEAKGELALQLFSLKRGQTVSLTGRYEAWTNSRGEGDAAVYYQNDIFKVLDRTTKMDGTPNPDAPAPITVIDTTVSKARHALELLAYGTVARAIRMIPLTGGGTKAAFTIANNSARADKASWFDIGCYRSVASDAAALVPKSLVSVKGSIRKYTADGRRRIEFVAREIKVISLPKSSAPAPTAPSAAQDAASALDALEQMEAGGQMQASNVVPFTGAIDTGDHGGKDTPATEGEQAPTTSRRRRGAQAAA